MKNKPLNELSPPEWFDAIREKYGLRGNFEFPDAWLEDLLSRLPKREREPARKVWLKRRSEKASHIQDEMMKQYLHQVLPVLSVDERKIADATFFGILPTYQFNAYTGLTPRGDRVAVFHHALVYTLAYWSHWYLRMKDEGGRDYLSERPQQLHGALTYILGVWLGRPPDEKLPDIYPKTKDSWGLDQMLILSAISFVVGHELGHVLRGHEGYSADINQNHEMEFEADRAGLSIAIRHTLVKAAVIKGDTYHTKFMLFGPLFGLGVMSLFGDRSSRTHPSPSHRRTRLLEAYKPELQTILGKHFTDFIDDVDHDVFDVLDKNSYWLFDIFNNYRNLITDLKSGIQSPDTSWIQNELAQCLA